MASVVLVEGESDRAALETLARRRGRDLAAEGVEVVAMGGATNIRAALAQAPAGVRVVCLADAAEAGHFRRTIDRAGRLDVELHVCDADLEDELIRALGTDVVESVIDEQGELDTFRKFQKQPFQRDRSLTQQLHRFLGTRSGRKVHYGSVLVEALALDVVPAPLDAAIG